ncbi:hypothetical protein [Streptomyces sp. NPDC060194]|uniref:hypothetical protein n=1 Tax=Streptomyces sp. NPDC060194 TaxID=3347069 RepID=UPI00364729BD
MPILRAVLILLGAGCFYLAYTYISVLPSERAEARRFRSLEEDGVAVQARLVSLQARPGDARASAVFELDVPGGDNVRGRRSVRVTPDLRVGGLHPAVRHRQFPDRFELGTAADMARIRRHHESAPRTALRWSATAIALGTALALTSALV